MFAQELCRTYWRLWCCLTIVDVYKIAQKKIKNRLLTKCSYLVLTDKNILSLTQFWSSDGAVSCLNAISLVPLFSLMSLRSSFSIHSILTLLLRGQFKLQPGQFFGAVRTRTCNFPIFLEKNGRETANKLKRRSRCLSGINIDNEANTVSLILRV